MVLGYSVGDFIVEAFPRRDEDNVGVSVEKVEYTACSDLDNAVSVSTHISDGTEHQGTYFAATNHKHISISYLPGQHE